MIAQDGMLALALGLAPPTDHLTRPGLALHRELVPAEALAHGLAGYSEAVPAEPHRRERSFVFDRLQARRGI